MMIMNNLKEVSKIVQFILEEDTRARNSDSYLYLRVLDYIAHRDGIFLAGMPVPYFLENMKELGFPPHESVRRTRQKIQAENPHLAANDRVKAMRDEQEMEYWAFATGKGVHP
jgi:hypothetical protein